MYTLTGVSSICAYNFNRYKCIHMYVYICMILFNVNALLEDIINFHYISYIATFIV